MEGGWPVILLPLRPCIAELCDVMDYFMQFVIIWGGGTYHPQNFDRQHTFHVWRQKSWMLSAAVSDPFCLRWIVFHALESNMLCQYFVPVASDKPSLRPFELSSKPADLFQNTPQPLEEMIQDKSRENWERTHCKLWDWSQSLCIILHLKTSSFEVHTCI